MTTETTPSKPNRIFSFITLGLLILEIVAFFLVKETVNIYHLGAKAVLISAILVVILSVISWKERISKVCFVAQVLIFVMIIILINFRHKKSPQPQPQFHAAQPVETTPLAPPASGTPAGLQTP